MTTSKWTPTQKLTSSGMIIAFYIAVLYVTQSFSFGAYQIRIATTLYALGYFCPFLIIPLGLANFISNFLFGGLGLVDMIGGCLVGIATTGAVSIIGKRKLHEVFVVVPIILIPGLLVPSYLSILLHVPYEALAFSLCMGQSVPAILGVILITQIKKHYVKKGEFLS